eukprot:scaffold3296_cov405-Prasinococcus_capsulatus_cf.AAC.19
MAALTMPQGNQGAISKSYAIMLAFVAPAFAVWAAGMVPLLAELFPVLPGWAYVLVRRTQRVFLETLVLPGDQPIQKGTAFTCGLAFLQSTSWMHIAASGLVSILQVVGLVLQIPDGVLGATVLAWGSCVGDLVTAIAITRAGQPLMAIAACFAGPVFNVLAGMSTALTMETMLHPTAKVHLTNGLLLLMIACILGLVLTQVRLCGPLDLPVYVQ